MWNRRCIILAAAVVVVLAFSCTRPEKAGGESIGSTAKLVSIKYIRSFYKGYPYTFSDNYKIRGYVLSDDRSGNVVNTLILKDESGIIEIKANASDLFIRYPVGTCVELSCGTLSLGVVGGVLQLGKANGGSDFQVGYIPGETFAHIAKAVGTSEEAMLAESIKITDLSDDCLSRFVSIPNIMFEEVVIDWCDTDPADSTKFVDTDRVITDRDGNRLAVRTARYAKFAGWKMPEGSGTIEGIVSKYAGAYRLKVINPDILYVTMSSPRFE